MEATRKIRDMLDLFHDAARLGDYDRYMDFFSDDAVFFGTDAKERWPMDRFRPYVKERFEAKDSWDYRPVERNVSLSFDRRVAWFDERLLHKLGEARGTGVVLLEKDEWRIAQYNLQFPIPNKFFRPFLQIMKASTEE